MESSRKIPDKELVDNIREGRQMEAMIRAIYADHFQGLSWYVRNNSGNQEDAEDIFQETVVSFIQAVQKDKFRGESTVKTFLFSLNRYTWLNELKRRGHAMAREEKYERAQDKVELDTSHLIAQKEGKAALQSLLSRLGETCKKILTLFYYENKPMKEILMSTDYENEQVLRNKKHKCIRQLTDMINDDPALKQNLKTLFHE